MNTRLNTFFLLLLVFLVAFFQNSFSYAAVSSGDRDLGDHLPYGRFPGMRLIGGSCDVAASEDYDELPERNQNYNGYYPKRSCTGQGITEDNFKLLFEVDLTRPSGIFRDVFPYLDERVLTHIEGATKEIVAVTLNSSQQFSIRSSGNTSQYGISLSVKKEGGLACAYARPQFYSFGDLANVPVNLNKRWRIEPEFPKDFFEVNDVPVNPETGEPLIELVVDRSRDSGGNLLTQRRFFNINEGEREYDTKVIHNTQLHCVQFPGQPEPKKTLNWGNLIADSCTDYSAIESHIDIPFTGVVVQCIEETIKNIFLDDPDTRGDVTNIFQAFQANIQATIRALIALYVIFIGYQLIIGGNKAPKKEEWAWFWLKIVLVLYFATGSGMSDMFFRINNVSKHLSLIFMEAGLGIASDSQLEALTIDLKEARRQLNRVKGGKKSIEQQIRARNHDLESARRQYIEQKIKEAEAQAAFDQAKERYDEAVAAANNTVTPKQEEFLNAVEAYASCYAEKTIKSVVEQSSPGSFTSTCSYPSGCTPPSGDGGSYQVALERCSSLLDGEEQPSAAPTLHSYENFLNNLKGDYNNAESDFNLAQDAKNLRELLADLESEKAPTGGQLSGAASVLDDPNFQFGGVFTIVDQYQGWSKTVGSGIEVQRGIKGGANNYAIELASNSNSGMARSFQTNPDDTSTFSLKIAARNTRNDYNYIQVWWDGQLIETVSTTDPNLTTRTVTLPATGKDSVQLELRAAGVGGSIGAVIDDFQFTANSANIDAQIQAVKDQCDANAFCVDKTGYPTIGSLDSKKDDLQAIKEAYADQIYNMGGAAVEASPRPGVTPVCSGDICSPPTYEVGDKVPNDFGSLLRDEIQGLNELKEAAKNALDLEEARLKSAQDLIEILERRMETLNQTLGELNDQLVEFDNSATLEDAQQQFEDATQAINVRKAELALQGVEVEPGSGYNYCDFRFDTYTPGYEWMKLWDTVDCRIAKYYGMTVYRDDESIADLYQLASVDVTSETGASSESAFGGDQGVPDEGARPQRSTQPALIWFLAGAIFIPGPGVLIFILAVAIIITLSLIVFRVTYIYIVAFMSLALLVYISPLTIPSVLFKFTKSVFNKWFNQIITFALQPVILFAYLAFMFAMMDGAFFGGNYEFDGYNQIKLVDGQCPDTKAMGCAMQESRLYYKENFLSRMLGPDWKFLAVAINIIPLDLLVGFFKMFVICLVGHILLEPIEQIAAKLTLGNSATAATSFSSPVSSPVTAAKGVGRGLNSIYKAPGRVGALINDTKTGQKMVAAIREKGVAGAVGDAARRGATAAGKAVTAPVRGVQNAKKGIEGRIDKYNKSVKDRESKQAAHKEWKKTATKWERTKHGAGEAAGFAGGFLSNLLNVGLSVTKRSAQLAVLTLGVGLDVTRSAVNNDIANNGTGEVGGRNPFSRIANAAGKASRDTFGGEDGLDAKRERRLKEEEAEVKAERAERRAIASYDQRVAKAAEKIANAEDRLANAGERSSVKLPPSPPDIEV